MTQLSPSVFQDGMQGPLIVSTPKPISGAAYTIVSGDDWLIVGGATNMTITVPADPTEGFLPFLPSGPVVNVTVNGTATVTFVGASGVTINSLGGALSLAGQYAVASLIKEGSNLWKLAGAIV